MTGTPLLKLIVNVIKYLFKSPEIAAYRTQAITIASVLLASILAVIFVVPIPGSAEALGVLHRFEEQSIRAGVDGFIEQCNVTSGDRLEKNEPIFTLSKRRIECRTR